MLLVLHTVLQHSLTQKQCCKLLHGLATTYTISICSVPQWLKFYIRQNFINASLNCSSVIQILMLAAENSLNLNRIWCRIRRISYHREAWYRWVEKLQYNLVNRTCHVSHKSLNKRCLMIMISVMPEFNMRCLFHYGNIEPVKGQTASRRQNERIRQRARSKPRHLCSFRDPNLTTAEKARRF